MVGGCDQAVGKRAHLPGPLRNADRDCDRDILADALLGVGAAYFQHAAGDHRALAQRRRRQHDAELVAAGPRQKVAGPQPGLRHQGEMLQAGIAGGVAISVVDALEAVEIDHQQRERLAAALRAGTFLGQALQQMTAVADAGEIVEQREIGDFVAQMVHRHQQEAEIQRHRQEHQHQDHHRLQLAELHVGESAADTGETGDHPEGVDGDDEEGDDGGQPGPRIDAPLLRGQQQLHTQQQRQGLGDRKIGDARRRAVIDEHENGHAGEAQAR